MDRLISHSSTFSENLLPLDMLDLKSAKVVDSAEASRAEQWETDNISSFLLLTDENGHRWEIRIPADDSVEHRRVGRTGWVTGWPTSLPSSRDVESLFDSAMLVLKNPETP